MSSNFEFLKPHFEELFEHATQVETLAKSSPRACCFYARYTLEQAVLWLYDNEAYLERPSDDSLGSLIHQQTFQDNLKPGIFDKVRNIHKIGNMAAHDSQPIHPKDALHIIKELFQFLYWLYRYYAPDGNKLPKNLQFNPNLITESKQKIDLSVTEIQELQAKLSLEKKRNQKSAAQIQALRTEIAAIKQSNVAVDDTHDYKEAESCKYLVNILLKEAGWPIYQDNYQQYPVEAMPNTTGKGYIDYVLWGSNGKPLGIVEVKNPSKSATDIKHQAKLYADYLEEKFQQRPVIFYTNGYECWIWDDVTYPSRQIQGFYKQDELERLIFRRQNRKKLSLFKPKPEIAGRNYQIEAVKSITDTFDTEKRRKALLVMATGTGKTRVAISLIDVLKQANWVKRVLFLADRTALLTQAFRAFKSNLSTVTVVNLTQNRDVQSADVVLSTYQTIFNSINFLDQNERLFSPGHFDLIVIDEAHRSIYQKYQAIFDYFDSLLVGLTATPRSDVHRDTYRLFDREEGRPTYAYELEDAIADGYLVPPEGINVPFKFLRQGVKYQDLSPEEKAEYEMKFRDEDSDDLPEFVDAAAINKWLFNKSTIDQTLELLMEKGLKIEGGDRLGKTIIFARNHQHAEYIVKRFDANYPHYQGKFAQVIDSHNSSAQNLLDDFSDLEKQPTIAVSVDMLDTGVDVPEVLNLVFFKPVYSLVKFYQMIGRGTRLCPDLFGVNQPKEKFYIFDLCGNFDYFSEKITEKDPKPPESLTTSLVKLRLKLSEALVDTNSQALRNSLLDYLHQHVSSMERENFLIRRHLQLVEEFSSRDRFLELDKKDIDNINNILASLPNSLPKENELAKRFDLTCLNLQLALVNKYPGFPVYKDKIKDLMASLQVKQSIPLVNEQMPLIIAVQGEQWWLDVTVEKIEELRISLRNLVSFIDREEQEIIYTDFADKLETVETGKLIIQPTGFSREQYRKRIESYIEDNFDFPIIVKIQTNQSLTKSDLQSLESILYDPQLIETKERFEDVYGQNLNLILFIRQLVGLDKSVVEKAFSEFLEDNQISRNQRHFLENIIDCLTQNGVMDPELLYESPFTDYHPSGLDGIFNDDQADKIVEIIKSFQC